MRAIIYTDSRLGNLYFAPDCTVEYRAGQLVLFTLSGSGPLVIKGDDFILRKLYDNLTFGVEENVLAGILSYMKKPELLEKLKEGCYIE